MVSRRTVAGMQRTIFSLVLAALLAMSIVGLATRLAAEAQPAASRIVVADRSDRDPVVARTIDELEQHGFDRRAVADVGALAERTGLQTVVFTPAALQHAPQSVLEALYRGGATLAALDVPMPSLLSRIGIEEPSNPNLPPPCDCWLTPSPEHAIFSVVRSADGRSSQISDVLSTTDRLLTALRRAERSDHPTGRAPSPPPSPQLPVPEVPATTAPGVVTGANTTRVTPGAGRWLVSLRVPLDHSRSLIYS